MLCGHDPGGAFLSDRLNAAIVGHGVADDDLDLRAITAATVDLGEQRQARRRRLHPVELRRQTGRAGDGTTATGRVRLTGVGLSRAAEASFAGAAGLADASSVAVSAAVTALRASANARRRSKSVRRAEVSVDDSPKIGTQLRLLLPQVFHHRRHLSDQVENLDLLWWQHRTSSQVRCVGKGLRAEVSAGQAEALLQPAWHRQPAAQQPAWAQDLRVAPAAHRGVAGRACGSDAITRAVASFGTGAAGDATGAGTGGAAGDDPWMEPGSRAT